MRTLEKMVLATLGLLIVTSQAGCLVNRVVQTSAVLDIPNTITARGFRYLKKGITGRYEVKGIFPGKLNREEVVRALNVADEAYRRMVQASGGLADNQTLVNVVVEVAFVQKGGELFMALGFYADKIELSAATASHAEHRRRALTRQIRVEIDRAVRSS